MAKVESGRDINTFVRLPWRIYANDPAWVPPLLMDRKDFINKKKHPFFHHGSADFFIAYREGQPVGRILVSDDPNYNREHGTKIACFGMFESIDDEEVAGALLDTAASWAREQGRDTLMGPIDYSTNYQVGLLVDGFETPPRIMMNHNPPYYGRLLEAWGLTKAKDLYAYWITDEKEIPERFRRVANMAARRGGVSIRKANLKRYEEEAHAIKEVYNAAWEKNWGFVKMTDAEFDHLAKDLKLLIDPDVVFFAEVDGKTVGFSLALPDINEALRHIDGKLTTFGLPIGLGKLLYHSKRIRTIRLITLGVLSGYRRRGIAEQMILHTYDEGKKKGYTACEMGWTLEDNDLINRPIEMIGGERYKTYRIYQKALP
ncbi:MAG: N-acetyltransferase [Deltaproteobacteria bacterium]|nr:MAG: N-acetyltransferase [Deltaproteobacteria bacterium]